MARVALLHASASLVRALALLACGAQLGGALDALRAQEGQRQPYLKDLNAARNAHYAAGAVAPYYAAGGAGLAPAAAPAAWAPGPGMPSWDHVFPGRPCPGEAEEPQPNASAPAPGPSAPLFSAEQCGIENSGPVCFGDGAQGQIVLPMAVGAGVLGYWPFDQGSVLDQSGLHNHGYGTVIPGPAFGGQGSSAFFHRSFLEVPDAEGRLNLEDFSYTFWVYLIEDGTPAGSQACPIVRKGLAAGERFMGDSGRQYDAAPAILYDRYTRRLRIEIITLGSPGSLPGDPLLEAFESNAKLRPNRWVHVALAHADGERRTRLYVNGILDASHQPRGKMRPLKEPLYVGGDPLTREQCDLPMYIDELRVHGRALEADEIEAEAAPALSGVEPAFLKLGCVDCPLELAQRLCPEGYHICSSLDMHMGGYQVAHSMGYLGPETHVWTRSAAAALQTRRVVARAFGRRGAPAGGSASKASALAGEPEAFRAYSSLPGVPMSSDAAIPGGGDARSRADAMRRAVVTLVGPEPAHESERGPPSEAVAEIPKVGLGLCCVDL